jgi:hypothetical protein
LFLTWTARWPKTTIDRAIVLNLDGRAVVAWPIRRVNSLRNDAVEFMTNVSDPSFYSLEIASDAGRAEGMIADPRFDAGGFRPPADDAVSLLLEEGILVSWPVLRRPVRKR